MSILPKKNPRIEWEVPKGRDISNLVISQTGIDPKTKFRLIPEHLKPLAKKIQHLTKLLEAEIKVYDIELSKCEVQEIRRIEREQREAIEEVRNERIKKEKKKLIRNLTGFDKKLAKATGLTSTERKALAYKEFLEMAGKDLPENLRQNAEKFIADTKHRFGTEEL